MPNKPDKLCLTLLCPPTVEEKLLDLLLEAAGQAVFTSTPIFSHGLAPNSLNPAEQVMGRSASVQLQIIVEDADIEPLLQRLREAFRGTGLRYWASPLLLEGEIE